MEKLFPNVDPLDKEISIAGIPFRVIGVTEKVGSTFGQSQDNFAVVPLTTFRSYLGGAARADGIHQSPGRQPHDGAGG